VGETRRKNAEEHKTISQDLFTETSEKHKNDKLKSKDDINDDVTIKKSLVSEEILQIHVLIYILHKLISIW
ncbi:1632_t:CDS:1, partial [Racocetra fulgida]